MSQRHGRVGSTLAGVLSVFLLIALTTPGPALADEPVTLRYFTWAGGTSAQHIREDFIEPFQELYPTSRSNTRRSASASSSTSSSPTMLGQAPDLMHAHERRIRVRLRRSRDPVQPTASGRPPTSTPRISSWSPSKRCAIPTWRRGTSTGSRSLSSCRRSTTIKHV